jgi:3-isopropylmalate dehydrogenase
MSEKKIAILPGDGIGPEIMTEALRVLEAVTKNSKIKFTFQQGLIGGAAYEKTGQHLPEETIQLAKDSDAILFGSVGGPISEAEHPKWKDCEKNALLGLRKAFNFYANLRPARVYPALQSICPLKEKVIGSGVDLLIVRELIGDIYFGLHETVEENGEIIARDIAEYTATQINDIAHVAFKAALTRKRIVTSVDKANVLDTSRLFRKVVSEVAKEYPDVTLSHMLVDNCAMQLIQNPAQFDVIVTSNMFGDILSDAAAVLPGSLGLTPSASFSKTGLAMYEPSGGSAPDIAGKGIANPTAMILSVAMMLRHSFNMNREADLIEQALNSCFTNGFRTKDIASAGEKVLSTKEFTDKLLNELTPLIV